MSDLAHFERERYVGRWNRTVNRLRVFGNVMSTPTRMTEKKIRGIPNLGALIRGTLKLRRDLERLMKRFPEKGVAPENRIFPRLLSTRWRYLDEGPSNLRQTEAAKWIEQYRRYIQELDDYVCGVLLKPDSFNALPFNGKSELSAEECIRRLELQEEALQRFDMDDRIGRLQAAVKRHGVQKVARALRLSRDTVSDLINGRIKNPNKTTNEKLEKGLNTLE